MKIEGVVLVGTKSVCRTPGFAGANPATGQMSRILRGNQRIWKKPLLSDETNTSHAISNIEHHHFKYDTLALPLRSHGMKRADAGLAEVRVP